MSQVNRFLSNVNTSWNPSFVIPNFARDLETAGVNIQQYGEKGIGKEVAYTTLKALKGIRDNLRSGEKDSEWAKDKENVTVHIGEWINILPELNDSFDAIYNDADEDSKDKLSNFPEICKRLAKNECVLYMTNWGNEFLERALPYHTLDSDENLQELFGTESIRIPYSTYENSDWS